MNVITALQNLIPIGIVAAAVWFLWSKVKDAEGEAIVKTEPKKSVLDYVGLLFDNPKKVIYVLIVFVVLMMALFAIPSRGEASELYLDAGSAVVRGETPTLGLNITFPRQGPANTDYEVGFNLIGQSDHRQHNPNQFVVHGMLVDGYKNFEMGMGFAYFNVPSEYNCQFTYSLLGRWRFNDRFHAQWHHFSTAGSCKPNPGRDLLTIGYRF